MGEYSGFRSKRYLIGDRINRRDEHGLAQRDSQSFSLSYRITGKAFMAAENLTISRNEQTRRNGSGRPVLQKTTIVIIGDETNFLTFRLIGYQKPKLGSQLTGFRFGQATERQQKMSEQFLVQVIQDVGLVLSFIQPF